MDVMLHVTSRDSGKIAMPIMRALKRSNANWGCFLTNDGVELLDNKDFIVALSGSTQSMACEYSWEKSGRSLEDCPIARGSQTFNSTMMGNASRLISL
tara:strand:+ start:160 stop:453 length:294 start_codon:yes stop_codon:yes gene_type:complete